MIAASGLPRSGTSMLMQMLEAGGVPVVIDNKRKSDENNPRGYFEFEPVKKKDVLWSNEYGGNAIKVISFHLKKFENYLEKIILMNRDLDEVFESANKMLASIDKPQLDEKLKEIWQTHFDETLKWIKTTDIPCLIIGHGAIIKDPLDGAKRIERFLGMDLDTEAMANVVDPDLYRNRRKDVN